MKTIICIMTDLTDIQKNEFVSMASLCNAKHLEVCSCQNPAITKVYQDIYNSDFEKQEEFKDSPYILESRRDRYKNDAIKHVASLCIKDGVRCSFEIKEILNIIGLFDEKYEMNDPRVFMIVRSLIAHKLSAIRMQCYSSYHGLLQEQFDKDGNSSFVLNPVEESKRKFDDAVIKAVEVLNKIVDGEKSNLNLSGKVDLVKVLAAIETKSIDQLDVHQDEIDDV